MSTFITHHHVKSKFTKDYGLFNNWFKNSYSLINRLVLCNLQFTQMELCKHLSRNLEKHVGHIVTPAITYWVNPRGKRHVTVTMTFQDIAKIKYRIAVPSLVNDHEKKLRAMYDLGVLIGDLSQEFYHCSYNDFDVYQAWQNKSLNSDWSCYVDTEYKNRPVPVNTWRVLFDVYLPGKDYDWELLLETLYNLAGGWPTDWLLNYKTHDELSRIPTYRKVN